MIYFITSVLYFIVLYCTSYSSTLCVMQEAVSLQSVCIWEAESNVEVGMA